VQRPATDATSRRELQDRLLREAEEARMNALEEARRREDRKAVEATEDEKRRQEDNRRAEEEARSGPSRRWLKLRARPRQNRLPPVAAAPAPEGVPTPEAEAKPATSAAINPASDDRPRTTVGPKPKGFVQIKRPIRRARPAARATIAAATASSRSPVRWVMMKAVPAPARSPR
jgi:translation initiation factor IF-2